MQYLSPLLLIVLLTLSFKTADQKKKDDGYRFENIASVKVTPVKNQYRSGTCWSYAATSFVEAEILRKTGKETDLSEMYTVYWAYRSKAESYVRLHGIANFGPGGQAHDMLDVIREHGLLRESDYNGLGPLGYDKPVHGELNEVLTDFLKGLVKNKDGKLSPVWQQSFGALLDSYLDAPPQSVNYEGQQLSPVELTRKLQFDPDDYIELSSYLHHPFYAPFRLEVSDNWSFNEHYYNLPLDELMKVIAHALQTGYTVCWDGDVSNKGFSHKNGVAIIPATREEDLQGSDMQRWQKLDKEELAAQAYAFRGPVPQVHASPQSRQQAFDNYSATDDHLMHLTGMARDQKGSLYFKTKNSWGKSNDYGGYLYMSEEYLRMNTLAIMVHKDALPKAIRQKLSL